MISVHGDWINEGQDEESHGYFKYEQQKSEETHKILQTVIILTPDKGN